ncbi:unnamed protein product, partial [Amoebophrya sp. A25]|eukprot:GSA25T00026854001.1
MMAACARPLMRTRGRPRQLLGSFRSVVMAQQRTRTLSSKSKTGDKNSNDETAQDLLQKEFDAEQNDLPLYKSGLEETDRAALFHGRTGTTATCAEVFAFFSMKNSSESSSSKHRIRERASATSITDESG